MLEELFFKDPDEMTFIIKDKEIVITNGRLMRSMDTGSDAFNCSIEWTPDDDFVLDDLTSPYNYQPCGIYLGDLLQMEGILYNVKHNRSKSGTSKDLGVFSKTADIIDSTVLSPYETNNISLIDRCIQQCKPFGIDVVVGDGVNLLVQRRVVTGNVKTRAEMATEFFNATNMRAISKINSDYQTVQTKGTYEVTGGIGREEEKFSRVGAEKTVKIFTHLSKLAAQKGLLLDCTKYGDLLITKANTTGKPVGTIEEQNPIADDYSANFNGRNRFTVYRALASSSRSTKTNWATNASDSVVKTPRILTFRSENNLPGEALSSAEWRKNKSAADAMSLPFPVNTWYAPNGDLWEPNTLVTVISPTIGIFSGFTFLITKVEFVFESNGISANLQLKPPSVYTTGEIDEPWVVE